MPKCSEKIEKSPASVVPKLPVNHFITAIHALGVFCGEVGDILRDQSEGGNSSAAQPDAPLHDRKGASLIPTDWGSPEQEGQHDSMS